MEKNTIVIDELGNEIGQTYPKRARGLVKNGRAEYVNDCTIRLLHAHAPTIIDESIMEETNMSNVINFNARDFRFDKTCQGVNVGTRMFITDMFGDSAEIYEIGDHKGNWTQIACEKTLDKQTDYCFRFAIVSQVDGPFATSQFVIVPIEGEEATQDDWDNRYVYNLSQCQYKPALSKRWGNAPIRVYEVPFQTGDIAKYRFVFVQHNAPARLMPAKELSAYDAFPDFSYTGWFNEKKEQIEKSVKDFNMDQTMKDVGETVRSAVDKIKSMYPNGVPFPSRNHGAKEEVNFNRSGENLNSDIVADVLNNLQDGGNVNFSNSNISDTVNPAEVYAKVDGCNVLVNNSNVCGKAFGAIVKVIGDGSNADFSNSNICAIGEDVDVKPADGCNIFLKNANISASALAVLMRLVGDGCNVDLQNSNIDLDTTELDFGAACDGSNFILRYATVPDAVRDALKRKADTDTNNITEF